ncbi:NAF1 domain-containing protein [Chloropicon primus]|nr:NAF1 domain-containing protein [Chloropicon primus]
MDLIAEYYEDGEDKSKGGDGEVDEGRAKAGIKGLEEVRRAETAEASSSSEYYSSSSEYYSSSSEGEEEGEEGKGKAEAEECDSESSTSASGVEGEEETARAASMIDSLLQSKGWEALNEAGSDDEEGGAAGAPRTKNEVEADVPLKPLERDLIQGTDTMVEVGKISCVVENTVVVQYGGGCSVYDIGSVFCVGQGNEQGEEQQAEPAAGVEGEGGNLPCKLAASDHLASPLGYVDEVFGPVKQPLYSLRCDNETVEKHCKVGTRVYAVERLSKVVVESKLYTKGYDNSGKFDEEVAPEEDDFSDDEKEMEVKRGRRQRKRKVGGRSNPKPPRGGDHHNKGYRPPQQLHHHHQAPVYPSYYQPPQHLYPQQPQQPYHHSVGPAAMPYGGAIPPYPQHQQQGGSNQAPGGYNNNNNSNNNNLYQQ